MHISTESLLVILLIGAVAGWLAGQIVQGTGFGLLGDIIIGKPVTIHIAAIVAHEVLGLRRKQADGVAAIGGAENDDALGVCRLLRGLGGGMNALATF